MMTTKFENLNRTHPERPERPAADSSNLVRDSAAGFPHGSQPIGASADALYHPQPLQETIPTDIVTIGNLRLELLSGLQQVIGNHSDRRWRQFYDYWLQLTRAQGTLPSRQAIDPLQMPRQLLPNVFMTEVVYETGNRPRFRFRLLGQEITEYEHTRPGQFVHELGGPGGGDAMEAQYLDCLKCRLWLRRTNLSWADRQKSFIHYDVLLLPLARDGREVDAMIGLAIYQN